MSKDQIGIVKDLGFVRDDKNVYKLSNGQCEFYSSSGPVWRDESNGQPYTFFTLYRVYHMEPPPSGWKGRLMTVACNGRTRVIEFVENDNGIIKGRRLNSSIIEKLAALVCACEKNCTLTSDWEDNICSTLTQSDSSSESKQSKTPKLPSWLSEKGFLEDFSKMAKARSWYKCIISPEPFYFFPVRGIQKYSSLEKSDTVHWFFKMADIASKVNFGRKLNKIIHSNGVSYDMALSSFKEAEYETDEKWKRAWKAVQAIAKEMVEEGIEPLIVGETGMIEGHVD